MKRTLSIILSFAVLFSMVSGFSAVPAQAAETYGARAVFGGLDGEELFLGGNYIELGVSQWGDFGTEGSKPTNFRGTSARSNLGMSADHDGFGQGLDLPIDYYLPGTEEERFAVGYKVGSTTYANSNSAIEGPKSMPTVVTNESNISNGLLQARIVSTWAGKMEITQVISFGENDKIYKNDVTIKNLSDEAWESARYMRSMDPDNTVDQGGPYVTANTVTHTFEEDGFAVVKAETTADNDALYKAFGTRAPIFFFSEDPAAKASVFGFRNENPYEAAAYDSPRAKGDTLVKDAGITITWDSGLLAAGESKSFTYYTSLDERPFDEVLQDIIKNNGIEETKENDGTVAGKLRVVSKGYTFQDPIDLDEIQINNLPAGITYTVKRVGDQLLEFTFAGQALLHGSENSTSDASVTIKKANFVDSPSDVTYAPFEIIFYDNPRIYIAQEYVVADSVYAFHSEDYVILKIKDARFKNEISNEHVTIDNLLPGMTYNVTKISNTELRITFSGKSTVVSDSSHAYVTIAAEAITGTNSNLTSNSFKIELDTKEPYLQVMTPLIYEDGDSSQISSEIIVNLVNGTFAEVIDLAALQAINLPAGLTVSQVERVSDTQLKVFLGGTAVSSDADDSVSDAMFIMIPDSIIPAEAHSVTGSVYQSVYSNTYSIIFHDSFTSLKVRESRIHDNPDGTVTETLTVILNKGTFAGDITDAVIVNNLPEGLGYTVERIHDTELKISFTGIPPEQNPASAYASVTVMPSAIVGAVEAVTSNPFDLAAPSNRTVAAKELDALTWDTIKKDNTDATDVTENLNLLTLGEKGSEISWSSSNPKVVSVDGTVKPSEVGMTDEEVTLTATITRGDVTLTKVFVVTVKSEYVLYEEDKEALTWDAIKDGNTDAADVKSDLDLMTAGKNDSQITWSSSNPAVIAADGTVNMSEVGRTDEVVTLTATITRGPFTETKTFVITVKTELPLFEADKDALTWDTIRNKNTVASDVGSTLDLVTAGENGTRITWSSSNPAVIAADGTIQRPGVTESDAEVTLTATISRGKLTETKQFVVTVKKQFGILNVNVEDSTPNQAVITFNGEVNPALTVEDFAGMTIAGKTITGVVIDGNQVRVTLSDSIAPSEALTVTYDPSAGNITDAAGTRELITLTQGTQGDIETSNTVVPLEVVAASIQDGKLKLVFNKDVDPGSVNLEGLKLGGAVVQAPFEVKGNELTVRLPKSYADNELTFDEGAITAAGNRNNPISDVEVDLGETGSYINSKGRVQDNNLNLLDKKGKNIELKPAFNADQSGVYSAKVPNEVSRLQVSTLPKQPNNTVMKVTLNGAAADIESLDGLALRVGQNVVRISIYDKENPDILLGQYEIVITREDVPDDAVKEIITVDVQDSGTSKQGVVSKTTIERVKLQDGTKRDHVTLPADIAQSAIDKILKAGSKSVSIIIPDAKDEVSEVDVNVPKASTKLFSDASVDLGITTDNVKVRVPSSSLDGFNDDLYFRFIPIKKEEEKQKVADRAKNDPIVKIVIGNNEMSVVGRPMTIDTNLQSRPVTLIMPLGDVNLSEEELQDLAIYIEHSDGTKELKRGTLVVYNEKGELGLEFSVDKFSTFTLVHGAGLANALGKANEHLSYIQGYPDGTFKPESSITRAEMASILSSVVDRSLSHDYSAYSDVTAAHWASAAIEKVTKMGLMNGYPDGSFAPEKTITREEMAALISRLVDDSVTSGAGFSDITGSWAMEAILKAQGAGFISGYSDGSFKPNRDLSRAEAVTIMNKVLGRGPIHELTKSIIFSDVPASHWALLDIAEASMDHSFERAENGVEQWIER